MTARRGSATLSVAVSADAGVRSPVSAVRVATAARHALKAERVADAMLSITLLDAKGMAALNRRHLGHRGPTDVISFAFRPDGQGAVVGDIYICPAEARANAKRLGRGVREELLRLVVHGVLHVLGHDHPVDDARESSAMWKRQELLLKRILRATA